MKNNKTKETLSLVYETDKWLGQDYNNKEEFIRDVMNCENLELEFERLSKYFMGICVGIDETNSSNPKEYRRNIKNLIHKLENHKL